MWKQRLEIIRFDKQHPGECTGKSRPQVTIEAADSSFTAPATIPSGCVDVTGKNVGAEGHQIQFVKLNGVSEEAFCRGGMSR